MKIVIIRSTSIFKDSRTSKWATELLAQGNEVLILGWDRLDEYNLEEEFKTANGIAKIRFYKEYCPYGGGIKNLFKQQRFQKWIKKQLASIGDDYIIHACDYDTAKPAFSAKRNRKFVYDIFDYFSESRNMPKPLKAIIKRDENRIINKSDAVVICTEQRRHQISGCAPKRLFVIHNTPNLEMENGSKIMRGDTNRVKVVYVGVLAEQRLLKELLDESKKHPDIELHIGGIGQYSDYVKALSETQDNIIYYGSMKYNDVLRLEKDCDLLFATYDPVVPNHKYSAPNKFYEAGALSKPIIVCKNTGVDELVEDAACGVAIEYSADAFFDAVENIMSNKELYNKMCENSRKAYEEKYSWEIMRDRIRELYKSME